MIRVWDISVRVTHWTLVAALTAAAVTGFVLGKTLLAWHLVGGILAIALVVWRLVWGIAGPTYARFTSFMYRPATVITHIRELGRRAQERHLGHNPLGALMVFTLLATVMAIGATGTVALGGMLKQGPLRHFLSYSTGLQAIGLHQAVAIALLILIGGHVSGVAFESWRSRENLVRAMVTGNKPVQPNAHHAAPARGHPVIAMACMALLLAIATASTVAFAKLPGLGVPATGIDPMFAEQCGACHLAFPPSLAPISTWDGILSDLQHHFGADATLSPDQIDEIKTWLDANAADHWDTLPSHVLRQPAPNGSRRITDTPGWRRRHRNIPDATFVTNPIYRRSNCEACHADAATGRFAPQNISIPSLIVAHKPR